MYQFPRLLDQNTSCSVTQSCPTDPMDCSTPGLPILHRLLEFAQTHVHGVGENTPILKSLQPVFFKMLRGSRRSCCADAA